MSEQTERLKSYAEAVKADIDALRVGAGPGWINEGAQVWQWIANLLLVSAQLSARLDALETDPLAKGFTMTLDTSAAATAPSFIDATPETDPAMLAQAAHACPFCEKPSTPTGAGAYRCEYHTWRPGSAPDVWELLDEDGTWLGVKLTPSA